MTYLIAVVAILVVAVFLFVRKSRYYGRIFSDEHYAEIAGWVSRVVARHPVEEPSTADGTALVTSAGLALAYTSVVNEGKRSIHFSVSQAGGYTTGAVGRRMLFLLIRLLHKNKCGANLFRAESTVHHAVFSMPADIPWVVVPVETVVADMANCPPLPIEALSVAPPAAP